MPIGKALLDEIVAAVASTPWYIPNAPVLYLIGRREVLGQYGHGVGQDLHLPGERYESVEPATHPDLVFSFTRRQCKKMLRTLRKESKRAMRG